MKLATRKNGTRDGQLVVVSADGMSCVPATDVAPHLQAALDAWDSLEPKLRKLSEALASGARKGEPLDPTTLLAPLPRAYEWVDGSAYINHIVLVRKSRGAEPPPTLRTEPLVYQGGTSEMIPARAPIRLADEAWGCDFESEVCVILGDVPQGTKRTDAAKYIRLVTICNDVSLRNLIPAELEKGFGFFQSKPATAFAPFVVTPDELGDDWRDLRLHLPLVTKLNGTKFGDPEAGKEMHFNFGDILEHVCKTRSFTAGTILGSGTVSNEDRTRGSSCILERRMIEKIDTGTMTTPFLKIGDRVEIEMHDQRGRSVFGKIEQTVTKLGSN